MARTADTLASSGAGRRTRLTLTVGGGGTAGSGLARSRYRAAQLSARPSSLRPRSVVQILDAACELFGARFAPLFAIGFCLWLPVQFLEHLLIRNDPGLAYLAAIMIGGSAEVLCAGFACVLVGASMRGAEISALDAFLAVLVRVPGLFVFSILAGVSRALLVCCVGVVGMWLFAVVPAVYVIERCNVLVAVGRGVSLVAAGGAFLRWCGTTLLAMLMTLPFLTLQQGLAVPGVRDRIREALSMSGSSLDFAIAALGAPYLAIASAFFGVVQAVFYFDLRVRREGFDLEQRIDALEAGAGA
jgi:hypothetical protein